MDMELSDPYVRARCPAQTSRRRQGGRDAKPNLRTIKCGLEDGLRVSILKLSDADLCAPSQQGLI